MCIPFSLNNGLTFRNKYWITANDRKRSGIQPHVVDVSLISYICFNVDCFPPLVRTHSPFSTGKAFICALYRQGLLQIHKYGWWQNTAA